MVYAKALRAFGCIAHAGSNPVLGTKMEIEDVLQEFGSELNGLTIKSKADLKLVLQSTITLNNGSLSMHGGEAGFDLILNSQTDAEMDLYRSGVSRDLLNKMTGKLLGVED